MVLLLTSCACVSVCVGGCTWVTFTLQNLVFPPRLQMTSCKRSRILMKTLIMAWDISHYIRCNAASSSWKFVGGLSKLRTLLLITHMRCKFDRVISPWYTSGNANTAAKFLEKRLHDALLTLNHLMKKIVA